MLIPPPTEKETTAPLKLRLVAFQNDGRVCLATTGDLTAVDLHPLNKNVFELVLGSQWTEARVVLDFHQTRFIDSAAIGWLIASQREFRKAGGVLAIHSVDSRVRRMLEILKVEQVIKLFPDESTATDFVNQGAGPGTGSADNIVV